MMRSLSVTDANKAWLLVPFGYALVSRYHWPRDFLVNAVTAWVPGVFLIWWLTQAGPGESAWLYVLGYLVFICVYEIGYLVNDSFGLRRDPTPRRRVDITFSRGFCSAFAAVRVLAGGACLTALGVADSVLIWASYAALAVLLLLHNTLAGVQFKFATFAQLSIIRFSLPVVPALLLASEAEAILLVMLTGLCLFTYPRWLTYLEAKGRLSLPERKDLYFPLFSLLLFLPLLLAIAAAWQNAAPLLVFAWLLFVQTAYITANRSAALRILRDRLGMHP